MQYAAAVKETLVIHRKSALDQSLPHIDNSSSSLLGSKNHN